MKTIMEEILSKYIIQEQSFLCLFFFLPLKTESSSGILYHNFSTSYLPQLGNSDQ